MKKVATILLFTLTFILYFWWPAISFTVGWRPFIGARARPTTSKTFETHPERLARGRYLVTAWWDVNSATRSRIGTLMGLPMFFRQGVSGQVLPVPGLPGRIVASNLTPM